VQQAKRIFLATGVEISQVLELKKDDTLYISEGEIFFKSAGVVPPFLGGGAAIP